MEGDRKTIDDVATLMTRTMASKEDLQPLATKDDMKGVEERLTTRLDHRDARVGRIETDVHTLRDEMGHRQEFQDVLDRVTYIEKKLGIESGV
jgi:hypothetical protein